MFTALLAAVDFSAVVTAIGAVAALLAAVKVAQYGFRKVLGFIR
jgi:hypothetical protein